MIPLKSFSQSTGELTTDSLVKMGFENVRWTDTPEERVYVVENSAYKIQADRKSTRLNSSHPLSSRMPSSA